MAKLLHLLLIASCVALLTVSGVLTIMEQKVGDPLIGVAADAKFPAINAKGIWAETTQKGLNDWYVQHWGPRPYAVRLDNSASYWVFNETRPEKVVKIGPNRTLWLHEVLWFWNRNDAPNVPAAAARFKRAQELALAHRKALVLIFLPAKSRFYDDQLPPEWVAPLGSPSERPAEAKVSTPFADELVRLGMKFVDGRKQLMETFGVAKRELAYPITGRHLTSAAMCQLLDSAMAIARTMLPDADVPPLDCAYEMRSDVPLFATEDFDLHNLLNVWAPRPANLIPVTRTVDRRPAYEHLPDALFVGSSFISRFVKEADRSHAIGETHTYYYNKTVHPLGSDKSWPVAPDTPSWRELTLKKRLIIVDMPEEYLVDHNAEFLDQLIKLLSETPVPED